jgi:Fic family protein
MPEFNHFDLAIINPSFESPLLDVLMKLEKLRDLNLRGTTPRTVFYQLKKIFHMLESLGSARIEGNHTTLADYVESKLDGNVSNEDHLREMTNIEDAMQYIEDSIVANSPITEAFIRELHLVAVKSLEREGDDTPGAYRKQNVRIAQSEHVPPNHSMVSGYMQELVDFINEEHNPKYDLIKVALAHHRFGWIHPFGNGNGRVVRLLTYALLIKYGFNVQAGGRLLNPTAVFCNNRNVYYEMLSKADKGTVENLEMWCFYVLNGILNELQKVDRLTQFDYLNKQILEPALGYAKSRNLITQNEERILAVAAKKGVVKASDLSDVMSSMNASQRTYQIRKLVDSNMLRPIKVGSRQYSIGFINSYLIRGVVKALREEGFVPETLDKIN